jgi:phospholipase D1/2
MADVLTARKILAPGRNCWTIDEVTAAGILVDACDYYRAFVDAALRAQRTILIAGWEFHSRVRLLRGEEEREAGLDSRFLPFLNHLCERNPALRIYLLAWDFGMVYFWTREWNQDWRFNQKSNPNLQFRFDDRHPIGASHHQKVVIVDNEVAFVGATDFCCGRWDDRRHEAVNPLRDGSPRKSAQHEVQAYVAGPAVAHLTEVFQTRWLASGGDAIPVGPPRSFEAWRTFGGALPLAAGDVAISRTQGQTLVPAQPTVREIRRLHIDAIHAAEELIYIENQYYSSEAVQEALIRRMRDVDRPKLDIVFLLPVKPKTVTETLSMGFAQMKMLAELKDVAAQTGHDLGVYYSVSHGPRGAEIPRYIHSKILGVDDRFLTVGSANTNNRSMGMDTELNVAWESDDAAFIESSMRLRASLLVEHTGTHVRELTLRRGLVRALDRIAALPESNLRLHPMRARFHRLRWLTSFRAHDLSIDPETPIEEGLADVSAPAVAVKKPNAMWLIVSRVWRWALMGATGAGVAYLLWSCL